jgi:hypothetical protein
MDDPSLLLSGGLSAQSHVATVRPWLQTFLASFLEFAHAYGYLHWLPLGAEETRGALDLYRRRWRQSATLARARAALCVARVLLAELHRRSTGANGAPIDLDGDEAGSILNAAVRAGEESREAVVAELAARWPAGSGAPGPADVLAVLKQALRVSAAAPSPAAQAHERFVPEGFR